MHIKFILICKQMFEMDNPPIVGEGVSLVFHFSGRINKRLKKLHVRHIELVMVVVKKS